MAIDTKLPIIHEQNQSLRETRRDAPELQCQLPTQPARSPSYKPEASHAHWVINWARASNQIKIPDRCEVCCAVGKVVAHHPNYNNSLFVVWLCHVCHGKLHLGKFMARHMVFDCLPEMFENDIEKSKAIETAWEESVHIVENECYIKGRLQTAII